MYDVENCDRVLFLRGRDVLHEYQQYYNIARSEKQSYQNIAISAISDFLFLTREMLEISHFNRQKESSTHGNALMYRYSYC